MTKMPIRDVSLYVRVIGGGTPLALMHGGPGLDYTTMLPFKPCAKQHTLIFYDHRCNGRSTGADVSSMTWDNLTADAEALRQALGFEKWAVLGHSFGGMVALEYALRYPDSLSHLLLIDSCGDIRWAQENAPRVLAGRGYGAETVESVRRAAGGLSATELRPQRLIGLPRRGPTRLIAAETDAPPVLLELQRRLATRLAREVRRRPGDRFLPHLTLCRFRAPTRHPTIEVPLDLPPFPVAEVRLMRSTLHPDGARHHEVSTVVLGEATR